MVTGADMTRRSKYEKERLFWDLVFGTVSGLVCLAIGFLAGGAFIGTIRAAGRWLGW